MLHPTSLPGGYGIGDLGDEAFRFVDFLAEARQTYWQILPLGPTGFGDSPYQCVSAFAGNTLLISPDKLIEEGLIAVGDLPEMSTEVVGEADFDAVRAWKDEVLPKAYAGYKRIAGDGFRREFDAFCRLNCFWLDDYALFCAIRAVNGRKPWQQWPEEFKLRDAVALQTERVRLSEDVEAEKFYQFLFFRQWSAVREYAGRNGVRLIGDIPFFVALDSADVWCNQDKFKLDPDGSAEVLAGVPPGYVSKTGQLWGNPIYDWDAMREDGFHWWTARVHSTLERVDIVRLDHFRGFVAEWEVPGKDETAENGRWVSVPGKELFAAMESSLGCLRVIAGDVGDIAPEIRDLCDGFGFPGMRILQFAFGGDAGNVDLPHNYVRNCVAYTGTHDNDTVTGWFDTQAGTFAENGRKPTPAFDHCLKYFGSDGKEIHWDFIRAVWASVAKTAIVPMQDLLGLGNEARMNMPAIERGNWRWRMNLYSISDETIERLAEMTETYGRATM
jgi:4-alpha-glucanotransferase